MPQLRAAFRKLLTRGRITNGDDEIRRGQRLERYRDERSRDLSARNGVERHGMRSGDDGVRARLTVLERQLRPQMLRPAEHVDAHHRAVALRVETNFAAHAGAIGLVNGHHDILLCGRDRGGKYERAKKTESNWSHDRYLGRRCGEP